MQLVKRVEIVVESVHEDTVERLIAKAGIDGYTLLRDVAGRGGRGGRDADGLTAVFRNVCFVVAAEPVAAAALVDAVRLLLRKYGGMCLLSDASWVVH